jgi:Na+/melibiose symporter-like transporter
MGAIPAILLLPGIGLAGSYIVFFVIYCLLQVSSNMAHGPYQGFIPDLVPAGRRGLAAGVKTLFEVGGGVALIYPIALLMDRYSTGQGELWLWLSLGLLAMVLLGTMIVTVVTVKERPGAGGAQLSLLSALYKSFKIDVRASPGFGWFLASRLLVLMAFTTLQTFALYFLQDVVEVADPAAATARFSIVAVAGMLVVVYPAGRLSDKIGRKPIAISAGLLGSLGIALIFLFRHNPTAIMVCGGLIGISFGAFMSTNWALAIDLVPRGEEARYLGLTNIATAGGAALARLIGPLIDFFNASSNGINPNLGYSVMLLACFIYFIIGSALLLKVRERR